MKDEFGRPFGKKELLQTILITMLTLFIVSMMFLIPALFPILFLVVMICFITILRMHRQKQNT